MIEEVIIAITAILWAIAASLLMIRYTVPSDQKRRFDDVITRYLTLTIVISTGSFVFLIPDETWEAFLRLVRNSLPQIKIAVASVLWLIGLIVIQRLYKAIAR